MTVPRTDHHDSESNPGLACDLSVAAGSLDRWAEADQGRHLLLSILPDTVHPQGKTFDWPEERATALRWIERCGVRCGLYWTVNVCRPNLMKKARKCHVQLLRAVWADLDPLDAPELGDQRRDLNSERERLCALARELQKHQHPPTVVIGTGNGIQPVWRLAAPLDASEEYVPQIEQLGRRIESALGGVENTSNIDRILRLPGTVNHPNARKRERGRVPIPTGIIYETGRLYSWRDLEALAANLEDEPLEHAMPVEFHPHRYTNGHDIDLDADLPPVATDEQLKALFENFPHIKAIWDKSTAFPPEDQSPSGWDQKFTSALAREGFEPTQLAAYLRVFRAHHEPTKGKQNRADYVWRTIDAATRGWEFSAGDDEPAAAEAAGAREQVDGQQQTAGDAQDKNRGTFKQGKPVADWPEPGVLGEGIPDGGLIIMRDGDPGEPEQALGGFGNAYYQHAVEIEVYVEEGDATARDAAFDALLQQIGAALEAAPTLDDLVFGLTYGRPEASIEAIAGAPAIKSATLSVTVDYETSAPLS